MRPLALKSKEEQVRNIIKCGKDPIFFFKNFLKIQHATRGLVPFETYDFQDSCVQAFREHRFNIVLKSRQLGLSTITAAYAVWLAIFHKDKSILVIATKLPTAVNFIKKVKVMLNNLPQWLLLPKMNPTTQSVTFSNGSSIAAIPTSEDAGRSEALSLLIVDEAAFIRNFEDIWTGLSPTLSTGGSAIVLSTPCGVGGQFYKMWMEGEAKANDFNTIRLSWDVHPEHDQTWFEKETKNLTKRKIGQEYMCDFVSSGDTFLTPAELEFVHDFIVPPIERAGLDRNIWVWKKPEMNRTYVVSADVSRGDAHDFSAFHVLDVDTAEVCVEYMGKIPPEELADVLFEWGKKYNDALVAPENNTFGYFVCKKLQLLGYPRIYYHSAKSDPFTYVPIDPANEKPGFPTQQKTRVAILAKLEELIRTKKLLTRSQRLYDQLQAFVWNGNKPQAMKGGHDDLVMSVAIASWLVDGSGSGMNEDATAMSWALLQATSVERRDSNELPGINVIRPLMSPAMELNSQNVYTPRDPGQTRFGNEDFGWLMR